VKDIIKKQKSCEKYLTFLQDFFAEENEE